jgi:hypothetical protein
VNSSCKDSELITDMLPADWGWGGGWGGWRQRQQSSATKYWVGRQAPHQDAGCDMVLAAQVYHTYTRSNAVG